jgi:hypothetical protein
MAPAWVTASRIEHGRGDTSSDASNGSAAVITAAPQSGRRDVDRASICRLYAQLVACGR